MKRAAETTITLKDTNGYEIVVKLTPEGLVIRQDKNSIGLPDYSAILLAKTILALVPEQ